MSEATHIVVANDEEQFSLWPLTKPLPSGWKAAGPEGTHDECLAFIDKTWVDMRPLSLRNALIEMTRVKSA